MSIDRDLDGLLDQSNAAGSNGKPFRGAKPETITHTFYGEHSHACDT
jgi:hypothetical protein